MAKLASGRKARLLWLLPFLVLVILEAFGLEPENWIRTHAIPLQTVEAGHGFSDMQPLARVVGDARIVALGEATHGTREFFQLKHRMLEFLATQKGFTIFSIEANMPEAYRLNDFVLNGKGDPKELLKGMYFWTWNTEEVLNMILWMREFNKSGKGRLQFTGFDMQTPNVSVDIVRTLIKRHDPQYYDTLNHIYSDVESMQKAENPGFGVGTASFPVKSAAGHHIKYSGYIRTENITKGSAALWWRADGNSGKVLAFDNMGDHGAKGTTPWTPYEIALNVPAETTNINFGVLHSGDGTAWFDSLRVEIDGVPYMDSSVFDPDFESESPRGFYTGGQGFQVGLDKSVAHSGKQSLRSVSVAGESVDQKKVTDECKQVLHHLEAVRTSLLRDSNAEEVDWTIQNARLVVQYMQIKTGEKSRDQSMAENIEWIVGQNPGAKIVLWAHNGHVAYTAPSFDPMGGYLRTKIGGALVNFGFAFNEGSFRAVEAGKLLHEFKVGPAPERSLDHALAAVGFPLFAFDLRQLPSHGPVAAWFALPRASRSIGAVYSDADSAAYLTPFRCQKAFDVILFVEKTTASRGNQ